MATDTLGSNKRDEDRFNEAADSSDNLSGDKNDGKGFWIIDDYSESVDYGGNKDNGQGHCTVAGNGGSFIGHIGNG